ncbi:MAG: secondary thiamine-phosphate synthase enzyme YjbQ [Candidatus Levyibacteriota bacterium]
MQHITIATKKPKEIVDITDHIRDLVSQESIEEGICFLFCQHTTAALTTADLDPGTDLDMLDAFEEMMPKLPYRHPHNPAHAPDHILASLIGPSLSIPIEEGQLTLGTWQRIVLVELDGPRQRKLTLQILPHYNSGK